MSTEKKGGYYNQQEWGAWKQDEREVVDSDMLRPRTWPWTWDAQEGLENKVTGRKAGQGMLVFVSSLVYFSMMDITD